MNLPLAFSKQIAITIDDGPMASTYLSGTERTEKIITALKESYTQATFFINPKKMNKEGAERVEAYDKATHLIANHSFSHLDLNTTDAQTFSQDIKNAHALIDKKYLNSTRWFRFPYLHEGDTPEKRNAVRATLKELGLENGYVTINTYDWHMNTIFQNAMKAKKEVNLEEFKKIYIRVLLDAANYYDKMAVESIGRSPRHTLLLHENDLAALFLKDLIVALKKDGWQIITAAYAYQDPIAKFETNVLFKRNPGRIGEIAHDKNWKGNLWHEACDEKYLENALKASIP